MADTKQYKVAVYIRLACENDEILEMQKGKVLHYAVEQGYGKHDELLIFADNGASGNNFNRPAFIEMNAAINSGEVNAVIVQSISRIGRDYVGTGQWLESMEKKGIAIKAVDGSCDFAPSPVIKTLLRFIEEEYKTKLKAHRQRNRKTKHKPPYRRKGGARHGS